jgi:hypothetical protein
VTTKAQELRLYSRLPTTCTLSVTSLEECALRMRPSRSYVLYVGERLHPWAARLLKTIGATTQEHPFAPYISLVYDGRLEPQEWCITNGEDESWGSEGL